MPVDSINRIPGLQVHQGANARDEKESREQKQNGKNKKEQKPGKNPETSVPDTAENVAPELSQILDSKKTVELLQHKPIEPNTLRKHAFQELTQNESVKKPNKNSKNKLNKSA